MAVVARLLPRHWDGRRLLQFLTGLALIAMAFAVPSLAPPAEPDTPPITIITPVGPEAAPGDTGADSEIVVVTPAEIDIVVDSLTSARPAGFGPAGVGSAAFGRTGFRAARSVTVGQVEATASQIDGQWSSAGWSGSGAAGSGTLVCSTARPAHEGVRPCAFGERGPPVG